MDFHQSFVESTKKRNDPPAFPSKFNVDDWVDHALPYPGGPKQITWKLWSGSRWVYGFQGRPVGLAFGDFEENLTKVEANASKSSELNWNAGNIPGSVPYLP